MNEWRNRITRSAEIDPEQLLAHPLNARIHPKNQQDALEGSLNELGWVKSVLVQEGTDVVIDGHARVTLALRHGVTSIPVEYVDLTDDEANLALASIDPISAMAAYDAQKLDELLRDVQSGEAGVQAMLAELAEQSGLHYGEQAEPVDDPGAQIDRAEELRDKWQTSLGQLWEIPSLSVSGRAHRLLCGDSTKAEDVARLMDGERATGVFTSPPYDQQRTYDGNMASDWYGLMVGVFDCALPVLTDDAQIFVNLGIVHRDGRVIRYWDRWIESVEAARWPLFGWYVWDKQNGMPGDWNGRLAPAHEWLFHFARQGVRPGKTMRSKHAGDSVGSSQRNPDGSLKRFTGNGDPIQAFKIPDSVVRLSPQKPDKLINNHPAPFPVDLPKAFLNAWQDRLWFDPFLGSATTMVAGEQSDSICYGMELSPAYTAVALERLAGMGLSPRLAEGGATPTPALPTRHLR